MNAHDDSFFQSVRLYIKGLDPTPVDLLMDQVIEREGEEYFFYDTQKNVLSMLIKDGILYLKIHMARNEKD